MNTDINPLIHESWKSVLHEELNAAYFEQLKVFVAEEQQAHKIYPSEEKIFAAFNSTPYNKVKVVLLGQDPYHGKCQAHGLCFSVPEGIPLPPSLKNIFKELQNDLGLPMPKYGNLSKWAEQGVLLINATLTVRDSQPGSHQKKGWETFTDHVIKNLSKKKSNLVFILWGNYAKAKESLIDLKKHKVLKAAHPSPFSAHRGFFGCKHFSKTNAYLKQNGLAEINWEL